MLANVLHFFLHKPTGMKSFSTPRWALVEAWNGLQRGLGGQGLVAVPVLLGAALITGCGLWSYLRQNRFVFLLFVLPGLVTLGGALAVRGTMYPRFFFFLLGFGLLVLARGLTVIGRGVAAMLAPGASPRLPRLIEAAMVVVLMGCSAASLGATIVIRNRISRGQWPVSTRSGPTVNR